MSKGGGQGSFAQMQEPGMGMDRGGFGGGGPQPAMFAQDYGFQDRNQIVPLGQPAPEPVQNQETGAYGNGLADNLTGFIPYSPDNASGGPGKNVIGDPPNPIIQELRPLPQPGGFGGAMRRFNNLSASDRERLGDLRVGDIFGSGPKMVGETPRPQFAEDQVSGPARPDPLDSIDLNRFSGGLGSKGGRSNPYQTDGIVPPTMRGQPLPGRRQFDPIDQPIARPDPAPRRTSRFTDAEHSAAEAQAREILGLPPKGGGRVYAGGTPNFNEGTGEYRTGGIKPPRGPARLEPIKMQPMPMPFEPVLSDGPDFRPPPEDIESRGTVGPGGGTRGRTGSFKDAIREFRDEFRYQPMPRREPPIFGPPRNFPFPMPRPPRMPPRQPPRMPGRNTQFQMPFFGSQYGRMNPYAGQFSGYGVPSNMFSFAQPNYQPYVPSAYSPPSMYTEPTPTAPPAMQLPPGQGAPTFGGGYGGFSGGSGGIGGFGRYNLGLAYDQLF